MEQRSVYLAGEMARLVDPKVVAVVGASETPGSFGQRTLANLAGFSGQVFGVNPKYPEVLGRPCVPTLRDLPVAPDCIALCVARPLVEEALRDAVAIGAGGAIIYASGYAETGLPGRAEAQAALTEIAQQGNLRMAGPNCVGIANLLSGAAVNFMAECGEMIRGRAGKVAVITQSGALGYSVLQAVHRGVGLSHYLAAGNSADVDGCDYLSYLAECEDVRAVIMLMEGVRSGARFLQAARLMEANGKALVVYKAGNAEAGGKAALSHTGTLVGSIGAYRAAFEAVGAIPCDSLEATIELASLFAKAPRPKGGRGVGIMATSGGAGVICADKAEQNGLPLPDLAPATRAALEQVVPEFGAVANPADITAEVLKTASSFEHCLRAFADDPGYSAVAVPLVFAHPMATGARAHVLGQVAASTESLITAIWMPEWLEGPGAAVLDADPRVAMFRSTDRAFQGIRCWLDWHARRAAPPAPPRRLSAPDAADRARAILRQARGDVLSEQESKALLAAYGIATPAEAMAATPEAAAEAARRIGFPVVVKVASADIAHKTEVGGIRLNLGSPEAVREAAAAVLASARAARPEARIDGVSVQAMVPPGTELVMGLTMDRQFGPLVTVGSGGVLVELLADTATALAPLSLDRARAMLESLRGWPLLAGFRGSPPRDIAAAVDTLCRLGELGADLAGLVAEADINPVIVGSKGAVAADALVVRAAG